VRIAPVGSRRAQIKARIPLTRTAERAARGTRSGAAKRAARTLDGDAALDSRAADHGESPHGAPG